MLTLKSAYQTSEDFTRTIFRANLGLYGYGYDFAKSRYQRTRKLLDTLVDHGAEVEDSARSQFENLGDELRTRSSEVRQRLITRTPVSKAVSLCKDAATGLRNRLVIPPARPITLLSERQLGVINAGIDTYNSTIIKLTGATAAKAKPAAKTTTARKPRARKPKATAATAA